MLIRLFHAVSPLWVILYPFAYFILRRLGVLRSGVQMIVLQGETVLLVLPSYRETWEFPGGGIEPGETALVAAIRETKEEAGVIVQTARLASDCAFVLESGTLVDPHLFVATAWSDPNDWRPSLEIRDRKFFPVTELPFQLSPEVRDAITPSVLPSPRLRDMV